MLLRQHQKLETLRGSYFAVLSIELHNQFWMSRYCLTKKVPPHTSKFKVTIAH